jgi:hypothetical protein
LCQFLIVVVWTFNSIPGSSAIDKPVAQGRVIPNGTNLGKARVTAACQFIVLALHNQFCVLYPPGRWRVLPAPRPF